MQKIYFDAARKIEVCDLSGAKDIEQVKQEFNAPGLVDVTAEREAKAAQDKAAQEVVSAREKLIQEKIREIAIAELVKEGKI